MNMYRIKLCIEALSEQKSGIGLEMQTVRKIKQMLAAFLTVFCTVGNYANAQKLAVSAGGDLVSSYIWRGQYAGGVSIQPSASISLSGFSLTAWGSTGFSSNDVREYDFTLAFDKAGFRLAVTDYWFDTSDNYFDYDVQTTAHIFEATAGYDFGVAAISCNIFFAGNDFHAADGKRAWSAYIEASVPFKLGGLDWKAEAALTPARGFYANCFNAVNAGIAVKKEISVTDSFSVPVFTKISFNPYQGKCFFTFGLTL